MLSTVKDFFQAPCVPQNSPNLGICQPAPIRHGGEGGGGPTAGQARTPGGEELERQPVTRREVRGCAEGRWERGLGFPARGRKAAGSAPGREPRNHCGRAGRAPPGRGWGCARSRLRGLFFFLFFFFFLSSGLRSCFCGSRSVYVNKSGMEAWSARFAEFALSRAPPRAACLKGRAGAWRKHRGTFLGLPSASLV